MTRRERATDHVWRAAELLLRLIVRLDDPIYALRARIGRR